jgi:DHA3 family tetracycline resistance protein-like MFS transporter
MNESQHSPKRSRIGIFKPLRSRDFALLWSGMTISLLGDGIYLVAVAFQVYKLSNSPAALSKVFFAWTAPMLLVFLVAGVLTDRMDRRKMMIAADLVRGIAMGGLGFLALSGDLTITLMLWLVAVYGVGDALFMPAFTAIVPDIVPAHLLVEANSLDQFVRPLTIRFAGPAIGGVLVATIQPGGAFLVDAVSFGVSALAVALMQNRHVPRVATEKKSIVREVSEGFSFVRRYTWLWGTLFSAAIGLLFFFGPLEVLVPYVVKNDLGGSAGDYGVVLSMGGVGAIIVSFLLGQRGLPKRHITFMYISWTLGVLMIASFAFVTAVWQAMLASFVMSSLFTMGLIVWGTLMHKLVPTELLGRVSSLDWLVSTSFIPVSFLLTGPAAKAFGVGHTLVGAGLAGAFLTIVCLLLPSIRDTEHDGSMDAVPDKIEPVVEQEGALL